MHREGHYGATLLLATPLVFLLSIDVALIGAGIMLLITPIPDKDHRLQSWAENSFLLRILPGGDRIKSACRHRGFSHTFLAAILVGLAAGVVVGLPLHLLNPGELNVGLVGQTTAEPGMIGAFISLMVAYGWIGHIYADALTVGSGRFGVKPYWPFSTKQVRFGYFKAANRWANGGFLLGGLMAFGGAVYYKLFYLGAMPLPA